jgi:hypothetical protein
MRNIDTVHVCQHIYIYYTYCYIIIHHLLFTYIQIVAMERDRPWTKRLSCFVILPYPVSTWAYCLGHHMNTPAMWGNWFHLSWDDTYKLVGNGFGCLKVNMGTIAKIFFFATASLLLSTTCLLKWPLSIAASQLIKLPTIQILLPSIP